MFKRLLIKLYRFFFRIPTISEDDRLHSRYTLNVKAGETLREGSPVYIGKDGKAYNYHRNEE